MMPTFSRPKRFVIFLSFIFLVFKLTVLSSNAQELLDKIVAVVNGEVITLSELYEVTASFLAGTDSEKRGPISSQELSATQLKILDSIIEKKLVRQEGEHLGILLSPQEIEEALTDIEKRNKITRADLISRLKREGINWDSFQQRVKEEFLASKTVDEVIRKRLNIIDAEIKNYYQNNISLYKTEERLKLQDIFLAFPKNASPEDKKKIMETITAIKKEIEKGRDFAEAAKLYSESPSAREGGELGIFKRGETIPQIEKAAFSLKVGEISDPVETEGGLHLIRLKEKTGGDLKSFEDARIEIGNILYQREFEKKYKEWLAKLKQKAYIDIRH